jgi:hypothetical protein
MVGNPRPLRGLQWSCLQQFPSLERFEPLARPLLGFRAVSVVGSAIVVSFVFSGGTTWEPPEVQAELSGWIVRTEMGG